MAERKGEKLRFAVEAIGADGSGPKLAGLASVISAVAAAVSRSLVFDLQLAALPFWRRRAGALPVPPFFPLASAPPTWTLRTRSHGSHTRTTSESLLTVYCIGPS